MSNCSMLEQEHGVKLDVGQDSLVEGLGMVQVEPSQMK